MDLTSDDTVQELYVAELPTRFWQALTMMLMTTGAA